MFNRVIFSERLIKLRTNNNIMAKDLASKIGISKQAISQYEKQQTTPSADILAAIAEYFNVSFDYLFGKTDNPNLTFDNKHSDIHNLTENEIELLEDFKHLDKYEKRIIKGRIAEMLYNKEIEKNSSKSEFSVELVNTEYKDKVNK